MTSTVEIGKLAELRQRTDRDLVKIMDTELERGLILASVAAARQSPLHIQAEKVHRVVSALLSRVGGLTAAERSAMESRLLELRRALDEAPAAGLEWHMTAR